MSRLDMERKASKSGARATASRRRPLSGRNEHAETLADGWSFTFANEAAFFARLPHHRWKGHFCAISQTTSERRDRAFAFCKSLAPQ